ncbi:MAG: hypothetical protein AAAB35_27935 [Phyllobacterium sp.]
MTGDCNPLHYDEGLASRSIFGRLIVQGGVTPGPGTSSSVPSGNLSRRRA